MKSLTWLFSCLLVDSSRVIGTAHIRDSQYAESRVKHEGLSFLTITLPTFARDFEKSLERGYIDSQDFQSFKKIGRSRPIPAFLSGLVSRVFDIRTGELLDAPCIASISMVRQLCLFHKKVQLSCHPKVTRRAYERYIECDNELRTSDRRRSTLLRRDFRHVAGVLYSDVFAGASSSLIEGRLIPSHGPGAVAEKGILPYTKYGDFAFRTPYPARLERLFPRDWYCHPGIGCSPFSGGSYDGSSLPDTLLPRDETPVKVVTVPKTLVSPRIIAVEPLWMQYIQQGISRDLVSRIETSRYAGGRIGFVDQSVNALQAMKGSIDGKTATLDLSEASDRVSCQVVWDLFASAKDLRDAIFACRSTRANVSGRTIVLRKFASMGSALCFPIEAMVFFTIIVLARIHRANLPVSPSTCRWAVDGVYVYGDDLIVPVDEVPVVIEHLEAFGLKVNSHKSFWNGKFRESCGSDWYDGIKVNAIYLRQPLWDDKLPRQGLASAVSLSNQLYKAGLWVTADAVRRHVQRTCRLPLVRSDASDLGFTTFYEASEATRWNAALHRLERRGTVLVPKNETCELSLVPFLQKFFLKGNMPYRESVFRAVRPYSAVTKRRWASA